MPFGDQVCVSNWCSYDMFLIRLFCWKKSSDDFQLRSRLRHQLTQSDGQTSQTGFPILASLRLMSLLRSFLPIQHKSHLRYQCVCNGFYKVDIMNSSSKAGHALESIEAKTWQARVPLEIRLSPSESRSFDKSDTYLVSRRSRARLSTRCPDLVIEMHSLLT